MDVRTDTILKTNEQPMAVVAWLVNKTEVMKDPLGQPKVQAGSDYRLILKLWDGRDCGRLHGSAQKYVITSSMFMRSCIFQIYMYGGTMRSGHTSRELWSLDLDLLSWDRVDWVPGQCTDRKGDDKLCGPIHSMGHTAHVVPSRMIVIFGHSPKYGYLDVVQEYHFGN